MSYDGISLKELKELMELKELIELKKLRELKEIKELKEESNYRIFFKENMALLSLKNDGKSSKERLKEVNEMWKLKKEIDDNSSTCSSNDTVITNTKKKNKDEIEVKEEIKIEVPKKESKKKNKDEIEVKEEIKIEVPKKKTQISSTVKKLVWNIHIGEEIGKSKCLCCKSTYIIQSSFHCGHVIAEANGGETIVSNLRPICQNCNSSMGTKNMNDFMKTLL